MNFPLSLPAFLIRFLRRLFRRTPPHTETGWLKVSRRAPEKDDANWRGLVEVYFQSDDSIAQAYYWSFSDMSPKLKNGYFWRKIDGPTPVDRTFAYHLRSRKIFG